MAQVVANIFVFPELPNKRHYSLNALCSRAPSLHADYSTPRPSVDDDNTSSDSDSTLTDISSTDESESVSSENYVHVDHPPATLKNEIQLILENDEAEFFAVVPSKDINNEKGDINKPMRKRDKIRSIFNKKFHRLNSDTPSIKSDGSAGEWNEMFAKTLVTMHQDVQGIIAGFDQIDQPITDDSLPNDSETTLTKPRLSFREHQRAKIEMMRMAQMLNPPNLLTCNTKESPYPYTDIVEPKNFTLLPAIKDMSSENFLVQHKPFRHKKFRYRAQRGLLHLRHDLKKLKYDLYGKSTIRSHKELPSLNVQNYRSRLEKTLLDVRTQIAEYDRVHSSTNNPRQSISQVISKLMSVDPAIQASIDDYRTKLRPIEYVGKNQKCELISRPFIPRRARYRSENMKKDDNDRFIDTRFDPLTFVNLNEEAETFFGVDIPFWHESPNSELSISSSSSRRPSNHVTLPSKLGVWARLVIAFKLKQKNLRDEECETSERHNDNPSKQSNDEGDDYYDCVSSSDQQKELRSQSIPFNEQSPLNNDEDSVDF